MALPAVAVLLTASASVLERRLTAMTLRSRQRPSSVVDRQPSRPTRPAGLAASLRAAVDAVDAELGGPQSYLRGDRDAAAHERLRGDRRRHRGRAVRLPRWRPGGAGADARRGDGQHVHGRARSTFDESAVLLGRIADQLPTADHRVGQRRGRSRRRGAVRRARRARTQVVCSTSSSAPTAPILSVEPV